jgi:hypothetical protein
MLLYDSHDMKYSDIYLYNHRYNFVSLHKTIGFKIKSISFCQLGLILRFNRLIMILMLNKSFNIGANSVGLIGKLPFVFWEEYVCYVTTLGGRWRRRVWPILALRENPWRPELGDPNLALGHRIWDLAIGWPAESAKLRLGYGAESAKPNPLF